MIFVAIDTQYAADTNDEALALRLAAEYFAEQLDSYLTGTPVADLQFVTEEE